MVSPDGADLFDPGFGPGTPLRFVEGGASDLLSSVTLAALGAGDPLVDSVVLSAGGALMTGVEAGTDASSDGDGLGDGLGDDLADGLGDGFADTLGDGFADDLGDAFTVTLDGGTGSDENLDRSSGRRCKVTFLLCFVDLVPDLIDGVDAMTLFGFVNTTLVGGR